MIAESGTPVREVLAEGHAVDPCRQPPVSGEQVRVLDLSDAPVGARALVGVGDFYLLDDTRVVAMRYDQAGVFTGAEPVGDPYAEVYCTAVRAAWSNAEPFDRWWSRHPEHHRSAAVR